MKKKRNFVLFKNEHKMPAKFWYFSCMPLDLKQKKNNIYTNQEKRDRKKGIIIY